MRNRYMYAHGAWKATRYSPSPAPNGTPEMYLASSSLLSRPGPSSILQEIIFSGSPSRGMNE